MNYFLYIVLGLIAIVWICRFVYEIGVKLKIFKSPEQKQYEAVKMEAEQAKSISLDERLQQLSSYKSVIKMRVPASEAIDLGLSVKWALVNVGAENSYQSGCYFAWGECVIKDEDSFKPETSLTFGMTDEDLTTKGIIKNGTLTRQFDVAAQAWGNGWRMPTEEELDELFTKCKNQWIPGVGIELVSPNGNHITLPITGFCDETGERYKHPNVSNVDVVSIWTSTRNGEIGGQSLLYDYDNVSCQSKVSSLISTKAYIGLCVRPVHD